ncbi:protoporphyrinogen oxidase [Centruroides vittatus]|uniref:protoporphyrinogen oxidase n=1 Tax=Centruroides vittatus TaxID=120091 RepID=UPI00350FF27B
MGHIVVLGGGISGLSCAYYLSRLGRNTIKKITLIERCQTYGGLIKTTKFPDETIFEHGPRSLRTAGLSGLNTLKLAEELGISNNILPVTRTSPAGRKRLILVNDKLITLPNNFMQLFRRIPPFSKAFIWFLLNDVITKRKKIDDESLHNFVSRRFGQEIADYIIDPVCRGIVAGDAREISARSLISNIFNLEQNYGSIIIGQLRQKKELNPLEVKSELIFKAKQEGWTMWTFNDGLYFLPKSLLNFLENNELISLCNNIECQKIIFENNKAKVITSENTIEADYVFSCIPSQSLSQIVSEQYPQLSNLLSSISTVHVGTVNLEYDGNCLKEEGFGFLVPSNQNSKLLGVVFDSCCFPEHNGKTRNKTRLTCMMGGHWFSNLFGNVDKVSSDMLLDTAKNEIENHLGIKESPVRHFVTIYKNCIPQYKVGHYSIINKLNEFITTNKLRLSLLGASYEGVGVNDCIFNSRKSVESYLKR